MKGIQGSGFRELVDRLWQKAMTVRAIADVLSTVEAAELSPDTVRSLGMLLLAEADAIVAALKRLSPWGRRDGA